MKKIKFESIRSFQDYYDYVTYDFKKIAKVRKESLKIFIKEAFNKTLTEFKKDVSKDYHRKMCHSFWHRECENKDIMCDKCCEFKSYAQLAKKNRTRN